VRKDRLTCTPDKDRKVMSLVVGFVTLQPRKTVPQPRVGRVVVVAYTKLQALKPWLFAENQR